MAYDGHAGFRPNGAEDTGAPVKAVLGPTNTGKTHLAIERMCAHSSGAIGFPLRLLAREVYDRVCAIKGENRVALITGEERIEPKDARYLLCTAEAMPAMRERGGKDLAFVALDEAQLAADRERGHVFTDRLLHARGREETMILGSATIEPLIRSLVPRAEIVGRPRFSTLTHAGARKLSRIPPRSAIVAFSAEQVYAIAEMLRRFRGGAAVVMGALSPQTRNAQVALYQSGEVDYLVATDAIGMGLNLDVGHVAFAGLSKFDGVRQRRLAPAEMAQIAGRAGRHQRDGTFGTLSGTFAGAGGHDAAFTDEEVYAIEEHRFAPLTHLYWREPQPRFDSLDVLIADLEAPPNRQELIRPPEAIDLTVLKRLAEEPGVAATLRSAHEVARFWEVCRLPDFRQHGPDAHARFVARLWQDLRPHNSKGGVLGADYVAQAIAQLDNVSGDIDTLQGRIAAIRSWAYIAQRPDWVLAADEMAARARAVEARLSDALHARLTERFVNRRTSVLMKTAGRSAHLLSIGLEGDEVLVEGELIGTLTGFSFETDQTARHADRKLLLAAAERHLPALLDRRVGELTQALAAGEQPLALDGGRIMFRGKALARLAAGRDVLHPRLAPDRVLDPLSAPARARLVEMLEAWLAAMLKPLDPLRRLDAASRARDAGPELRALLIRLVEAGGMLAREGSGIEALDKAQRTRLARLGVRVGALDVFVPAMIAPGALGAWAELSPLAGGKARAPDARMPPVVAITKGALPPPGYRPLGPQAVRLDMAEKLLRDAHEARGAAKAGTFALDPRRAVSMGLTPASHARLLRLAGFRGVEPRPIAKGACGPPAPPRWRWRPDRHPSRRTDPPHRPAAGEKGAMFAALAELVR